MVKLEDVFGVRKESILSYVARDHVDNRFLDALRTDRQIIVYGSSKQGKTSLVEKYVPYENNIVISCSPATQISDLYKSVLRQLKIEIIAETEHQKGLEGQVGIVAKFKAVIPIFATTEAQVSTSGKASSSNKATHKTVDFNLNLPQDVTELIKEVGSKKVIILENFHYLDDEIQKQLSFDLRTFQELGVRFIILGVWREKNRLAQYNGDLLDRIIEIPVEPWLESEFKKVVELGENHLNITFASDLINTLIKDGFDSIGVIQELLKGICALAGISASQKHKTEIKDMSLLEKAKAIKAEDYSARHIRALEDIAKGQKSIRVKEDQLAPLFLPYYLVQVILSVDFDEIIKGIKRSKLEDEIKKLHHRPQDVRASDTSNLLYNLSKMQNDKGISPPIFDFDRVSQELKIIDSTFYFFLRNANRGDIAKQIMSPLDAVGEDKKTRR